MFPGFKSRWMIPAACAADSAARQLPADADHGRYRQPLALQPLAERLAFDVLHHDERARLAVDQIVDRRHVGVRDPGGEARLTKDVGGEIARRREQALEGDFPLQARVAGEKHLAHPAVTEPVEDHVRTDHLSWRQIGGSGPLVERRVGQRVRLIQRPHQALDLGAQRRIGAALGDIRLALRGRAGHGGEDHRLRLLPLRRVHSRPSCMRTSPIGLRVISNVKSSSDEQDDSRFPCKRANVAQTRSSRRRVRGRIDPAAARAQSG